MAKGKPNSRETPKPNRAPNRRGLALGIAGAVALLGFLGGFQLARKGDSSAARLTNSVAGAPSPQSSQSNTSAIPSTNTAATPTLEVAHAVMVTVDLDFGDTLPTIAEAIGQVQRRSQPDDGKGRTFAILEAFGNRTPEGKLRLSMRVSAEKPGLGSLTFKRTGEVLWTSRIVPSSDPAKRQFSGKDLLIYLDNGAGKLLTVDGSNNPGWVGEAVVRELGMLVEQAWPDGAERELTFMYSACGCPVKVMAKREGQRVVRTKDQPVLFPDDPAVLSVIARLMRW